MLRFKQYGMHIIILNKNFLIFFTKNLDKSDGGIITIVIFEFHPCKRINKFTHSFRRVGDKQKGTLQNRVPFIML